MWLQSPHSQPPSQAGLANCSLEALFRRTATDTGSTKDLLCVMDLLSPTQAALSFLLTE